MSFENCPLWLFRAPTEARVGRFLQANAEKGVSYAEVGASSGKPPAGYDLDHNRVQLGAGEAVFERACAALRAWRMFPQPWTRISPAHAALREGQLVAMQAKACGLWWVNGCRIVYLIDEAQPVRRFGFAYGTLPAHVEQGEERFLIELLPDETVWYEIRAFSRPRYWMVRLAKPLARRLQRRFVRDSQAAMGRAVTEVT